MGRCARRTEKSPPSAMLRRALRVASGCSPRTGKRGAREEGPRRRGHSQFHRRSRQGRPGGSGRDASPPPTMRWFKQAKVATPGPHAPTPLLCCVVFRVQGALRPACVRAWHLPNALRCAPGGQARARCSPAAPQGQRPARILGARSKCHGPRPDGGGEDHGRGLRERERGEEDTHRRRWGGGARRAAAGAPVWCASCGRWCAPPLRWRVCCYASTSCCPLHGGRRCTHTHTHHPRERNRHRGTGPGQQTGRSETTTNHIYCIYCRLSLLLSHDVTQVPFFFFRPPSVRARPLLPPSLRARARAQWPAGRPEGTAA